jgi:hypothetical protein
LGPWNVGLPFSGGSAAAGEARTTAWGLGWGRIAGGIDPATDDYDYIIGYPFDTLIPGRRSGNGWTRIGHRIPYRGVRIKPGSLMCGAD